MSFFKTLENKPQAFLFTARSDTLFIENILPHLIKLLEKADCKISLMLDTRDPSGVLASTLKQSSLLEITTKIENFQRNLSFEFQKTTYDSRSIRSKNRLQFNFPFKETHCFRGYPIYGSFKQFIDTDAKYILHLDCDMIFYEAPGFLMDPRGNQESWRKTKIFFAFYPEEVLQLRMDHYIKEPHLMRLMKKEGSIYSKILPADTT